MKTFFAVVMMLMILSACNQKPFVDPFIKPDNPNLIYTGRFDFSDSAKPVFMYSGCAIGVDFTGSSIAMYLKDDSLRNFFNVVLDDSIFVLRTDRSDSSYLLAKGLENKLHHLKVWRRTEWHGGNSTFLGFMVDSGASVKKPQIQERKLEFIGNSYTCGYGNEGTAPTDNFKYETENNYMTYGAITARALNAQYLAVCRSGIGIIQGYGGSKGFTMPRFYDEVTLDTLKRWNFNSYIPDAVVIVLGGNDLSVKLDTAAFVKAYVRFVQRIRIYYPESQIVCVAGPADEGQKFSTWKSMIHSAVNESCKTDSLVHYFEFSPFSMHGSDYHPNIGEHEQMATELTKFLKELLQW